MFHFLINLVKKLRYRESIFCVMSILTAGLLYGVALYENFYQLFEICSIEYLVAIRESLPFATIMLFVGITSLCIFLLWLYYIKLCLKRSPRPLWTDLKDFSMSFCPLVFYSPFLVMEQDFTTAVFFILTTSLCVFRMYVIWPGIEKEHEKKGSSKIYFIFLLIVIGFFVFQDTRYQKKLFDVMWLDYWDWGQFLDIVKNTIHGRWFFCNGHGFNYLGEHFSPGAILVLVPFVWLFQSETAFFLMNSMLLNLPAVLIYMLALKKGIIPQKSFLLAALYLLCPSVSNMSVSLFYGFHLDYMAIGTIIGFFLLLEYNRTKTALLLFALSLTIKDTVAVYWIGVSFILFIQGRKKLALGILLSSIAYFFLITKVVMLLITGKSQYNLIYRYTQLGDSFTDILLSPFYKTEVFWSSLARYQNVYLTLMVLAPIAILIFSAPEWILAGILIFLFVCLQVNVEGVNSYIQYQSEILAGLYCGLVYAFKKISDRPVNIWNDILLLGIKHWKARRIADSALLAVLIGALFSFYFYSIACSIGANSMKERLNFIDCREVIDHYKSLIQEGASLSASSRAAAHFILRNDTWLINKNAKEYVLLDLGDRLTNNEAFETFRYRVLRSKNYMVKDLRRDNDHIWVFLHKEPKLTNSTRLTHPSDKEWEALGTPCASPLPEISIMGNYNTNLKKLEVYFKLNKKINHDLFMLLISKDQDSENFTETIIPFGDGAEPAYMAQPGDVFKYTMDTENSDISFGVPFIIRRPVPNFTEDPF